jgi:hypothetical protein
MDRTVTMQEVLLGYNPRLKYGSANPLDYYLLDLFLKGIYSPTPRPELMLVNLGERDVEAVINYHESRHLMYEMDITLNNVPLGLNLEMFFANLDRSPSKPDIPYEVMQPFDKFDLELIKTPLIIERTLSDWLAIYAFGLHALKQGGVMVTFLQDIDLVGYQAIKNNLQNLTGAVPLLEEDTPFTLDEIIGRTYHRVSIYGKMEKFEHPQKNHNGFFLN